MSDCPVCVHPLRRDIEAALVADATPAEVSERYGVDRRALVGHYIDHSPGPMPRAMPRRAGLKGTLYD